MIEYIPYILYAVIFVACMSIAYNIGKSVAFRLTLKAKNKALDDFFGTINNLDDVSTKVIHQCAKAHFEIQRACNLAKKNNVVLVELDDHTYRLVRVDQMQQKEGQS